MAKRPSLSDLLRPGKEIGGLRVHFRGRPSLCVFHPATSLREKCERFKLDSNLIGLGLRHQFSEIIRCRTVSRPALLFVSFLIKNFSLFELHSALAVLFQGPGCVEPVVQFLPLLFLSHLVPLRPQAPLRISESLSCRREHFECIFFLFLPTECLRLFQ